jgi:hypothetical protein
VPIKLRLAVAGNRRSSSSGELSDDSGPVAVGTNLVKSASTPPHLQASVVAGVAGKLTVHVSLLPLAGRAGSGRRPSPSRYR